MNDVQKILTHFGLEASDAKIYLILAQNKELDVPKMQLLTDFSRTTIYQAIDVLTKHDLITFRKIGRSVFYRIKHPDNLKKLLNEKKQHDAEIERNFLQNINNLTNNYNLISNQPGIHIFEGKEGIIKTYEDLLEDKLPINSIEDKDNIMQIVPEYPLQYLKKRIRYGLQSRVIAPSTNASEKTDKNELRETRFIDANVFPFEMTINMNDKKVIFATLKEKTAIGVVIIHPEIVKNFQILFNAFWLLAKA